MEMPRPPLPTLAALMVLAVPPALPAQSVRTANTLALDDPADAAPATLSDVDFVVGRWEGEAFGGVGEEVWLPPSGGSLPGFYRLVVDGAVRFYELLAIREEEGSLTLSLKHFDPDLTGWEEREEVQEFRLVKIEEGAAYFDGFTFRLLPDGRLEIAVAMERDGEVTEGRFVYRRVDDP